jgi:hypothetical protein
MANEHICATALYYYDSSNITEAYLAFRESVHDTFFYENYYEYTRDQLRVLIEIYGLKSDHDVYPSVRHTLVPIAPIHSHAMLCHVTSRHVTNTTRTSSQHNKS